MSGKEGCELLERTAQTPAGYASSGALSDVPLGRRAALADIGGQSVAQ